MKYYFGDNEAEIVVLLWGKPNSEFESKKS